MALSEDDFLLDFLFNGLALSSADEAVEYLVSQRVQRALAEDLVQTWNRERPDLVRVSLVERQRLAEELLRQARARHRGAQRSRR